MKQKKQKRSRFFDKYYERYGDNCTLAVPVPELKKNIRTFIRDVVNGGIFTDKNIGFLRNDCRIINLAILECEDHIRQLEIIGYLYNIANSVPLSSYIQQVMNLPDYYIVAKQEANRCQVYKIILNLTGESRFFILKKEK